MANNVDPDQMLQNAASDLVLYCLQMPICSDTKGYYSIQLLSSCNMWKYTFSFWCVLGEDAIIMYIHAVWSGFSLSSWRNFASLALQNASSEDFNQTASLMILVRSHPLDRWWFWRDNPLYLVILARHIHWISDDSSEILFTGPLMILVKHHPLELLKFCWDTIYWTSDDSGETLSVGSLIILDLWWFWWDPIHWISDDFCKIPSTGSLVILVEPLDLMILVRPHHLDWWFWWGPIHRISDDSVETLSVRWFWWDPFHWTSYPSGESHQLLDLWWFWWDLIHWI